MSIHHPDHAPYRQYTRRQRIDKAVNTLTGLLRGVSIDGLLNAAEAAEILNWCTDYSDLIGRSPFDELKQKLDEILADGVIDPEEQEDLLWLCMNLAPDSEFYDSVTHDIQQLQGILHGILADGEISHEEAKRLQEWIDQSSHLRGIYPYDEIDSLLTAVLRDGTIDSEEHKLLKQFFDDFIDYSFAKKVRRESDHFRKGSPREYTLPGICAMCPDIVFSERVFTFTGTSIKGLRQSLVDHIIARGGTFSPNVTQNTQYLVIGAAGNPCWAFSCYGRKVEKAVTYRKSGIPIVIVHESDFWDAIADNQS